MVAYLDSTAFALKTLLPQPVLDDVESATPGWLAAQLTDFGDYIDTRLAKRYGVPFAAPYPVIVVQWTVHVVQWRAYLKRGVNSLDQQAQSYEALHDRALTELEEAANSETGLFDLPINTGEAVKSSAIRTGYPLSYTETSPYVSQDRKATTGRTEDENKTGTTR